MIVGRRYAIYSLFFYVCSVLYITIILVCQTTIFALFAFNCELIKQLVCKLKAKKKQSFRCRFYVVDLYEGAFWKISQKLY